MRHEIIVRAFRDEEANVWVAEGMNYPGIVAESESFDALLKKLTVIIPEVVQANEESATNDEIAFRLLSDISAVAKAERPHA